jgi:hypothetical protein
VPSYSPDRRTALVLCGTGAHGAYQAGVLRALQEVGVRVDVMAGHGVGAASAALAAIDGTAKLTDATGLWRGRGVTALYGWKWPIRWAGWVTLALAGVLATPLLFLAAGLVVYPVGFLLEMVGADTGASLVASYTGWLQRMFAGENLPTIIPRLAMVTAGVAVGILIAGALLAHWQTPVKRRADGAWWWRLFGAPLDAEPARRLFGRAIWDTIRGAAPVPEPDRVGLGRRYAEVLQENVAQPGFRELVLVVSDLDARRDVVATMLREPYRQLFLSPRPDRDRRSEVIDLTGVGRDHLIDVVDAALTPPLGCDPQAVTFAADSFWRGETHRFCDRAAVVSRLLDEVAAAGAKQIIVVSAVAPAEAPHRLRHPRLDLRARVGELLTVADATGLRDALERARTLFEGVHVISPAHNAVGPFDFTGAYDESSDRRRDLGELMERGYEDAYRQFIEPVVGASGDHLARMPETSGAVHSVE